MRTLFSSVGFPAAFLLVIVCVENFPAHGQNSATSTSAGTINTTSVTQGFDWTNPTNVQSLNGAYATSLITGSNRSTYYLNATNWGFQSTLSGQPNYIPPSATINGIEVYVTLRKTNTGNIRDNRVILLKAGSEAGTNKARSTTWPATASEVKFGSSVDLWGTTWTASDLINSGFGVRISARNRGNKTAQAEIDHIRIIVYFNQTFYYSKSSGNLELTSTWGINTDGTGSAPTNFTNNGQLFFIRNRTTATLTANFSVSGTNSKVVVGDGTNPTTLTIPSTFALNAVTDVAANSSIVLNNPTIPTLSTIASNTTVTYGATTTQNVTEASYYNITLSGSGDKLLQTGTSGATTVSNVLTINAGVNFNNQGNNVIILGASDGISNSGAASGTGRYIYSLQDANTSITGTGGATYSNLEIDFTTTGSARTLTLANAASITGTLYLTDGSFANGSNLTMSSGSTIALADGILGSSVATSTGYDVIYNPYTTTSPKTTANELTGNLRNFTLQTGTGLTVNLDRNLVLTGNLLLSSGTLDPTASNYNITAGGNFTNNATLTSRNNIFTLNGSGSQAISGTTTQNFYDLVINQSSPGTIQLNMPVTVNHALTLTNGVIVTNSTNLLTLGNAVTISGGNNSSYVDGPLRHTMAALSGIKSFPIGKNAAYRPLSLNITQISTAATNYTAEVFAGSPPVRTLPPDLDKVSSVRYFTVSSSNNSNLNAASITLNYGSDDDVTDHPDLRIVKSNGSNWENIGGIGTASGTGSITSNAFSSFSDFVLANAVGGMNVLPLNWLSFKAEKNSNSIKLIWQTAEEENTDRFEIDRKGNDNSWEIIGRKKSNNNVLNRYEFIDNTPLTPINYYRIRSVDMDGKISYSNVISVNFNNSYDGISIIPNPVSGSSFNCHINDAFLLQQKTVLLQLIDMNGKVILNFKTKPLPVIKVFHGKLAAGNYILHIQGKERSFRKNFIIQQ
jgi:hypothetical protein